MTLSPRRETMDTAGISPVSSTRGGADTLFLLDVSRLISRIGRGPFTGIDRVELAYLRWLVRGASPILLHARASPGHVLLDRTGARALLDRLDGAVAWGTADLVARLYRRHAPIRRRVLSDLRRLSVARVWSDRPERILAGRLVQGTVCLGVGHGRLHPALVAAIGQVPEARLAVMVHDTIPLDHPDHSSAGLPARFAAWLAQVGSNADLVIYNSAQSQRDAERHYPARRPPGVVAHLGVDIPAVDPRTPLPPGIDPQRPWFVVLGTIEPRKNHALLLDVWDQIAARFDADLRPQLVIAGRRGWRNEALFARLDTHAARGRDLHEFNDLNDAQVARLLAGSAGLLFPSLSEGYGLPAVEAAALGVPVVCSDLPVFREVLGTAAVYADPADPYAWAEWVTRTAGGEHTPADAGGSFRAMDWDTHFALVLAALDCVRTTVGTTA